MKIDKLLCLGSCSKRGIFFEVAKISIIFRVTGNLHYLGGGGVLKNKLQN